MYSIILEGDQRLLLLLRPSRVCTGILWINNKDKLVVAGFTPGSQAKQAGVLCGDILRKVDGQDVLKMKSEVQAYPLCQVARAVGSLSGAEQLSLDLELDETSLGLTL